jgi:hypothetical protein
MGWVCSLMIVFLIDFRIFVLWFEVIGAFAYFTAGVWFVLLISF